MDPAIERLAAYPEELTLDQAAHILARGPDFVARASRLGTIEARMDIGRGTGANHRYLITRPALIAYLLRATTGDKTLLLAAIARHFPELAAWAHATAQGGAPAVPPPTHPATPRRPKPLTDHPDLFAAN